MPSNYQYDPYDCPDEKSCDFSDEEHVMFLQLVEALAAGGVPYGRAIIMVASFAVAVRNHANAI